MHADGLDVADCADYGVCGGYALSEQSVNYTTLGDKPSETINALLHGVRVPLTYRGQPFGTVTRLSPFAANISAEIATLPRVATSEFRNATQDHAERLREGGAFVLTRNERRIAVIEGVKS